MIRLDRNNFFDFVRLYAALQVLLHHASAHLDYPLPNLVEALFSFPGVPIFFALSGFLVSISWINNSASPDGWKSYAISRSLRIFPALWCAAIFGWLICLLFGKASFALSSLGFAWLLGQGSFVTFLNPDQLRDFGVGVMNGSLWTIPVEIEFYVLVPLFACFLLWIFRRNRFSAFAVVAGVVWASFALQHYLHGAISAGDGASPTNVPLYLKLVKVSVFPYIGQFLLGASFVGLLTRFGQIKCSRFLIFSGLFFGILVRLIDAGGVSSVLMSNLSLAAFFVGLGLVGSRFQLPGDISYGLYLYHMPVINLLLIVCAGVGTNYLFFLSFLFTILISLCSWVFVERPCLKFRKSLVAKLVS